jgi:hypothetical protein
VLESGRVQIIVTDGEVADFGSDDGRGAEYATELADLCLQSVGRIRHLAITPERVDQPVRADRVPSPERQQGQQSPLLSAAHGHRHALLQHLELAEELHLHDAQPYDRRPGDARALLEGVRRTHLSATAVAPQATSAASFIPAISTKGSRK